jgi:cyclophilin family peptidyl-prolyl cis-trans isomerase
MMVIALLACDDDAVNGTYNAASADLSRFVVMQTTRGDITIELFPDKAPLTVANFRRYAKEGFYDGSLIHRVIDNFIIQGGMYNADFMPLEGTHAPIPNEAGNGLSNLRGTIGMARTNDPQSATSSFFINQKDNVFLDHHDDTNPGYGYAVFGRVVDGMDVVDAIATTPTGTRNGLNDVPLTPIVIRRVVMFRPPLFPSASG